MTAPSPRYEQIAETHWRSYRPKAYAAMSPQERTTFFATLAEQVTAMTSTLAESRLRPQSPLATFEERKAQIETVWTLAEQDAVRELLLPGPESPEDDEDEDPYGGI